MVEGVPPELKDTLRRLRRAHGCNSQSDLHELMTSAGYPISIGTIGNVESGTRNLGRQKLDQIAKVLELTDEEYAELLTAAGHDAAERDQYNSRLDAVERDVAEIKAMVRQLLKAPPPRRRK